MWITPMILALKKEPELAGVLTAFLSLVTFVLVLIVIDLTY